MNFHFRNALEDDLPFLLSLERQAFPVYQRASRESLRNGIRSNFQELFILEVEEDGLTPAGAIVLFKYKYTLRIYSIAISSSFRDQGLGIRCMEFIHEYAVRNHYRSLVLEARANDEKLIQWYENRNFKKQTRLKDHYEKGEDAWKMIQVLDTPVSLKGYSNLLVIDQPFAWEGPSLNAKVISVREYINDAAYQNQANYRVFNLCSSYRYQTYGYYVSLLASARGQRVIPDITTIRDMRISNVIQSVAFELNELLEEVLKKETEHTFTLDIFFGRTRQKRFRTLANRLYQIFEAPLFRVTFIRHEKWLIQRIKLLSFSGLNTEQKEEMYDLAVDFFEKKRHYIPKSVNYLYDLAVLVNPDEKNPPSDKAALEKLRKAANRKGVFLEFITREDKNRINEFDALFIRETTNVNHHTYEISRYAYAEGLVVMDDPWSILRCSNKIYQHELFRRNKIRTPHTIALTKNMVNDRMLEELTYPMVLKQPDSAFSLGVMKVRDKQEAREKLKELFKITDMVIGQEFLYSEYDWRIGILDNEPIYACKYYMSGGHWQIYDWNSGQEDSSGNSETLPVADVPSAVIRLAQRAATLIGDGLYGVDLKFVHGKVYVIEVNDNPNIDAGIEDLVLGAGLYTRIIESFIKRIEQARNIQHIPLIRS